MGLSDSGAILGVLVMLAIPVLVIATGVWLGIRWSRRGQDR